MAVDWINANGPFQCGAIAYSVGKNKQVKCRDVLRCVQLLLDACGGDVDMLCTFLRSEPFRYGACGEFLDQAQWNSVFAVEWQEKLVLKQTDQRFLPRQSASRTRRKEK